MTNVENKADLPFNDVYCSLPRALYSGQHVRDMDNKAIHEQRVDSFDLMQKAARFSFHALAKQWPKTSRLIVICGAGNNAGDGYIVASLAKRHGWNVQLFFASPPENLSGDAKRAYQTCLQENILCSRFDSEFFHTLCLKPHTVIVDALLGTGLNTAIKGSYASVIEAVNLSDCPIVALDIASGLSADTGIVLGKAIKADLTTTFIGLKLGLFTGEGRQYSGRIVFNDLELETQELATHPPLAFKLDLNDLLNQLKPRARDAHKGHHGHAMLIGGNIGYGGAILLASKALARMGAGLTTILTCDVHRTALLNAIPEAMIFTSENMQDIEQQLTKADVIVIGPGLGQNAWSEKMLLAALNSHKKLVIDADALNLLTKTFSSFVEEKAFKENQHIFTPHPKEAARLLDISTQDIQSNRIIAVESLHQKLGGSVLLKGSGSLICENNGQISLCPYGNPGMGSGGMGDVLSGLIGGLVAQNLSSDFALQLAVCLHSKAADIVSERDGERGLLANDLIPIARRLLNRL